MLTLATVFPIDALGDIIILSDFNARTRELQTLLYDRRSNSICSNEIDPTTLGLQRVFEDVLGPISCYGRHFLQLCEFSGMVILHSLSCFPGSKLFTCWPHCGGASVVDYALTSPSFISVIHSFTILCLPLVDHAVLYIHFRLALHSSSLFQPPHLVPSIAHSPARFHFTDDDSELFSFHLSRLPNLVCFPDSYEASSMFDLLATAIWKSAAKLFIAQFGLLLRLTLLIMLTFGCLTFVFFAARNDPSPLPSVRFVIPNSFGALFDPSFHS